TGVQTCALPISAPSARLPLWRCAGSGRRSSQGHPILGGMPRPPRQTGDLFRSRAAKDPSLVPLAERMRPRTLDEVVGQQHILGPNTLLREAIETDQVPSLIFWGP